MDRRGGVQRSLGILEGECLVDALLDKAKHSSCVDELIHSSLRGEGDTLCYLCPEECWACRAMNLLDRGFIRKHLAERRGLRVEP